MRAKLTPNRIEKFICPPDARQAFLRDTDSPRLAVRATAAGAKSYIFEGKVAGQTIRLTLGDCRTWTIEQARAEANRLAVEIDKGTDPRAARQKKRETARVRREETAERPQRTLTALGAAYVDLLAARGKTKSAADAKSVFRRHLPHSIAALPACDITSRQVAEAVRRVLESGKTRTAASLRSYLHAAYSAARRAPFDPQLPAALIGFNVEANPVEPVATIPTRAGNRTLSAEELRAYLRHLNDTPIDCALRIALLAGGQRMAQLLRAAVADYDAEGQTLRLFDGKGRRREPREHLLPLAPKAAALVEGLAMRAKRRGIKWLFSTVGRKPMADTTPGKRASEICKAMGGEPFDLRDIRRTCETMLAGMGISRDTRAQLLSHGISGVQAMHYDRHGYLDEKRAALVAWEARLDEIASGRKRAANVRKLRA